MLSRISTPLLAFAGSVLLLGGLIATLSWNGDRDAAHGEHAPLFVYCAEAMRLPMEAIAKDYEAAHKQKVELQFGASQTLLTSFEIRKKGDLFLPADDSYIRLAKQKDLVADVKHLATMQAVVIVRPGFAGEIKTWDDFLSPSVKLALANPDAAAVGKVARAHLQSSGRWSALEARKPHYLGTVNELANIIANDLGNIDAGIVWDAVAVPLQEKKPGLKIVHLQELADAKAHVQIAVTKFTKQRDSALRLVSFIRAKDKGAVHLKKYGYTGVEDGEAMDGKREIVVYAGAMLRDALEPALAEFEKRENVRITRVFNGCGILVSQMKTGQKPDLYFSCDTSFMRQVQDDFEPATNVSNNQLMIVVKKGNPKNVKTLADLSMPGLKVGVGHEHQCALGALTKETFLKSGVYANVAKNIAVQSPTGDFLIHQLVIGALDVVVAYRSNLAFHHDKLDGIPITGIPCATPSQPIAVRKNTEYPELTHRLMEFLKTAESRQRFEKLGFGWELKEVAK